MCRPFLPALFPDYELYLWCDSDMWIQRAESLEIYLEIAAEKGDKIPLSPLIDSSYGFHYTDGTEFMRYAKLWFGGCYGPTVGDSYANKAILSSGLFALRKDSPIWKLWANEIAHIFTRRFVSHDVSHLAEQTALSYLVYSRNALVPIEALHNYNCHIGRAARRHGKVVVNIPPFREIGIVHLSYSSRMMADYIKEGLLYRCGDYLSPAELSKLSLLAHY